MTEEGYGFNPYSKYGGEPHPDSPRPWENTSVEDGGYRAPIEYWYEGYTTRDWESGYLEYEEDYSWRVIGKPERVA